MEKNCPKYFFNGEAYDYLHRVIASSKNEFAKEDAEAVEDAVNSCLQYVNFVDVGENRIKRNQAALEYGDIDTAQFQQILTDYDTGRHNKHEAAIASANLLNRLSELYGGKKIYNGSSDRLEVADFCLEVTISLFRNRRM